MIISTRITRLALACLLVLGALLAPVAAQAAKGGKGNGNGGGGGGQTAATYQGQATVVALDTLLVDTVLADTGPLPQSGGALDASLLTADVPGVLSAEVLHATTIGEGNHTRSEASIANVDLTVAGLGIQAGLLMARASADCASGSASLSGSSQIADLVIAGQPIAVSGQPNQRISLLGVEIVINEQIHAGGAITVNALHVSALGIADVVLSSATAGITCGSVDPSVCADDFVTGGGWIVAPSGAKGTFGVGGGIKQGSFWGHLTYIDHGTGMKVKGTGVTAYVATGSTSRHIEGSAEINGVAGTYSVDVSDRGEPGRRDTFNLVLSNGYAASGKLDAGNIQLHRPCA